MTRADHLDGETRCHGRPPCGRPQQDIPYSARQDRCETQAACLLTSLLELAAGGVLANAAITTSDIASLWGSGLLPLTSRHRAIASPWFFECHIVPHGRLHSGTRLRVTC